MFRFVSLCTSDRSSVCCVRRALLCLNPLSPNTLAAANYPQLQVKEAQLKATKMALSRAVAAADVPAYMARQELSRRGL